MSDGLTYLTGMWTYGGIPDIGNGSDPKKNISLLDWFLRKYRYTEAEAAQVLGVSERTVYRWIAKRSLPRMAAMAILGISGARQARLGRWRSR